VQRRRAWRVAFTAGAVCVLTVTLGLVTLSCGLLQMPWTDVAFFGAVVAVMAFALNGLAIGLGVLYPNLKETNPNKIVSGFGGTLCFVLSSLYLLASLALLVAAGGGFHLSPGLTAACLAAFLGLSGGIGWLPLKWGLRQLKNFEAGKGRGRLSERPGTARAIVFIRAASPCRPQGFETARKNACRAFAAAGVAISATFPRRRIISACRHSAFVPRRQPD